MTISGICPGQFYLPVNAYTSMTGGSPLVCLFDTDKFTLISMHPELLLRRPNMGRYRLDRLLERKAMDGVKIYIIL